MRKGAYELITDFCNVSRSLRSTITVYHEYVVQWQWIFAITINTTVEACALKI